MGEREIKQCVGFLFVCVSGCACKLHDMKGGEEKSKRVLYIWEKER